MLTIIRNNGNQENMYEGRIDNYSLENSVNYHNSFIELKNSFESGIKYNKSSVCSEEILQGDNVNKFIVPTKMEKWSNGLYDLWDVGFKLINASEEYYNMLESIEVNLYRDDLIIATKRTSDTGVEELKKEDIFYGGIDGVLSCSFKARECEESTRYWISSAYDFTTPDRAEIRLSIKNKSSKTITTYVSCINNYNLMREKIRIIK